MKKNTLVLMMLIGLLSIEAKTRSADADDSDLRHVVFGMTPVVGVQSTKERFLPLAHFLSEKLDRPVELLVTKSYGELIEKVQEGKVDLAKFSPLAYVKAKQRIADLQLVATQVANGSVTYSSYIVSIEGNPHSSQKTIPGAKICFADPNSTSGYLFPLAWLMERRIDPRLDLSSITFGGNHRKCLDGLFDGRWDLAATWAGAIGDARADKMDVGELVIVAKTGRIPFDAWCLRPGLDPQVANKITQTLLNTNTLTHVGRKVLWPTLGINGWIPASDKTYDVIRNTIEHVGDLKNDISRYAHESP